MLFDQYEIDPARIEFVSEAGKRKQDEDDSVFERVVSREFNNIRQTASAVPNTDFYRLAEWMQGADPLLIGGFMASESLAEYIHYAAKLLPSAKLLPPFNTEASIFDVS